MTNARLTKADDFTTGTSPIGGEVRTLQVWLIIVLVQVRVISLQVGQAIVRAISSGADNSLAGRNIATGLRAEHFRSLLENLPDDFNEEEAGILARLRGNFEQTVAEFLAMAMAPDAPAPVDPPETHP